jgi:hypothetical protein
MLPHLLAVAAGTAIGERDYRLTVRAVPHAAVALRAHMPSGWIAAFCTASVCAPGHVVVHVPQSGKSAIALHIYRVRNDATHRGHVLIDAGDRVRVTLAVAF